MFLIDMHAPGVEVRPLRQISGAAHFNEVFLDEVALAPDALLGPLHGGWMVATTTLMFERLTLLANFEQLGMSAEQFVEPLLGCPAIDEDARVRERLAEVATSLLALRYSGYRALTALERGQIPGPEAGLGKIDVIEAGRRGAELAAELLGPEALAGHVGELAAEMPGMRSAGGTEEVLRSTIGERVLGLPAEPRLDKGIPFSELGRVTA
jgi:alkylation response protein AidB-like acyl-CoA dehydrogenase